MLSLPSSYRLQHNQNLQRHLKHIKYGIEKAEIKYCVTIKIVCTFLTQHVSTISNTLSDSFALNGGVCVCVVCKCVCVCVCVISGPNHYIR